MRSARRATRARIEACWGAEGQQVEIEIVSPGEGEPWVWGQNGEPVVVAQADVAEVDLESPDEGNIWV